MNVNVITRSQQAKEQRQCRAGLAQGLRVNPSTSSSSAAYTTTARPCFPVRHARPTRMWEVIRTVAAPRSISFKCGGVVLDVVGCGGVLVVSCVVLFLLCVRVCDLVLFHSSPRAESPPRPHPVFKTEDAHTQHHHHHTNARAHTHTTLSRTRAHACIKDTPN